MTDRFASTLYGYKSWNVFIKNLNFFSTEERNDHHEQHCDCSGVVQIPGHHHLSGPKVGRSHWVHCKKGPAQAVFLRQLRKFNLPQELLKQLYSAIIDSVLCTSITVWFSSATKSDLRRLQRVVRTAERIIGTPLPTLQELYLSRVSKRAGKITRTPYIQHTPSLNCYCLVDATELWAPERPDTGTVSSLRQSISWTLDNYYGTHTIYTPIYLRHILSLHFNCT